MHTEERMRNGVLALLVAGLVVWPAAAAAQQGQPRPGRDQAPDQDRSRMGMMSMQGHGAMMGMMVASNPTMMLRHGEALELTDQQVNRLEALRDQLAQRRTAHMEAMRALHGRMAEQATAEEMDLEAHESALRSMADAAVSMHMDAARVGQEAREVLSPEQREKLEVGMQFMRGSMRSMMGGMRNARMGAMGRGAGMGMGPMMMQGMMPGMCPLMGTDPEDDG